MEIKKIESSDNQYIKTYRKLNRKKWREKLGLIPLEGINLIEQAFQDQVDLSFIIISRDFNVNYENSRLLEKINKFKTPVFVVDNNIFRKTAFTDNPQGIISCTKKNKYKLEDILVSKKDILMGTSIQDPGNLGTLMRTARAFEFGGMVLTGDSVDPTNEKVVRSSMGAILTLPYYKELKQDEISLVKNIAKAGYDILAAIPSGELDSFELYLSESPVCIIVGNEAKGISKGVLSSGEVILKVKIPISAKLDSLNAAVAGSIIMYEVHKTRLYKGV